MFLLVWVFLGFAAVEAAINKVSSVSEPLPSDSAQKVAQNMYENQQNEQCGLTWVPHSGGDRVPYSVYIGMEAGHEVLVARSLFAGRLKPGKWVQGGSMTIAHGDQEMSRGDFQVLANPNNKYTKWVRYEKTLPSGAILGGSVDGTPVYIGRAKHQGHKVVGYLKPAQVGALVYTWNGDVYTNEQFELLTVKNCQVIVESPETANGEQRPEETRQEVTRPERPNQEPQRPVVQPGVHPGQPKPQPQPQQKPKVPEWQKKAEKQGKKWADQIESKAKKEGKRWRGKFEDKAKHEGAKWRHQAKKETHKWQKKINHQVDGWKHHNVLPSHHSHRSHHHVPSFHVPSFHIPHFG